MSSTRLRSALPSSTRRSTLSSQAPRHVCPLCATDEAVTALPIDGRDWAYSCTSRQGHTEPYGWTVTVRDHIDGRNGITSELGVYDDLLRCIHAGEPWVEHGIVEHRYKLFRADVYFDELLPRYGHVAQGPKRYTTSAFLAMALGQLRREGLLAWQYADATGFWSYNGKVSYWATLPAPPLETRRSWANFASDERLPAGQWSLARPG